MRYVNTLPKRGSGRSLRAVTYLPTYHLPSRWNRTIPPLYLFQRAGRGGGKLMRLPTGRYRTPLSRASLAENVSRLGEKFGNLSGEETWRSFPSDFRIDSIYTGSLCIRAVVFKVPGS